MIFVSSSILEPLKSNCSQNESQLILYKKYYFFTNWYVVDLRAFFIAKNRRKVC